MSKLRKQMQITMELANYSSSTITQYIGQVASCAVHFNCCPSLLTENQIRSYLHYLRGQGASWSKINMAHSALKFLHVRVLGLGWNVAKIPRPRKQKRLAVVFSHQELRDFFDAIPNLKHKVLMMTIYAGGLRLSEAIGLKINDIDSQRNQIRIRQGKGQKDRYTILGEALLPYLRKYWLEYRPNEWLFEGMPRSQPLSSTSVRAIFVRAKQKAGITKDVTTHSLRHSFATHLIEQGVSVAIIKEFLGHRNVKTTMDYIHIQKPNLQKIISPLDILLGK